VTVQPRWPPPASVTATLLVFSFGGIYLFSRGIRTFAHGGSPWTGMAFVFVGVACFTGSSIAGRSMRKRAPASNHREGATKGRAKDEHGRPIPGGLANLGIITLIMGGVAVATLTLGANESGRRGALLVICSGVGLACLVLLWAAIAVTQWKRRNLEPPE
jgi:drug/metabolite transporter (DMT)-like permease